jgi:hypothetical protein
MKVRVVNLFEEEQKRARSNRFLHLTSMIVLGFVATSFGQPTPVTDIDQGLRNVFADVVPIVQLAATGILAIMFITKIIPAVTGGQKDTNWWEIIGIIAAVIIINAAGAIFRGLTGHGIPGL